MHDPDCCCPKCVPYEDIEDCVIESETSEDAITITGYRYI